MQPLKTTKEEMQVNKQVPYPYGQFGTQEPNNYFNYCKVIMQLQQYFNHYSTPMNNINGKFNIITVVCCSCYIHPSS